MILAKFRPLRVHWIHNVKCLSVSHSFSRSLSSLELLFDFAVWHFRFFSYSCSDSDVFDFSSSLSESTSPVHGWNAFLLFCLSFQLPCYLCSLQTLSSFSVSASPYVSAVSFRLSLLSCESHCCDNYCKNQTKAYREWTWHHSSNCCKRSFQLSELFFTLSANSLIFFLPFAFLQNVPQPPPPVPSRKIWLRLHKRSLLAVTPPPVSFIGYYKSSSARTSVSWSDLSEHIKDTASDRASLVLSENIFAMSLC